MVMLSTGKARSDIRCRANCPLRASRQSSGFLQKCFRSFTLAPGMRDAIDLHEGPALTVK